MRHLALVLLAACAPVPDAHDPVVDLQPEGAMFVGSDPLTSMVPHLVRGTTVDVKVAVYLPNTVIGETVVMGLSANAGGSPGICPGALSGCLDLAAPAWAWTSSTVGSGPSSFEWAVSSAVVPAGAPVDQVDVQPVLDGAPGFLRGRRVQRGVYDRSEVCEVEVVSTNGVGAYIAYTDLDVVNPYVEGLLAWEEPSAGFTVFVPNGENLILRDYVGGNVTQVINHDAGDAVLFDGEIGEAHLVVSCP
ncbi:MAG: hypothetical protein H6733_11630 [Alphaproteobacteria bacterium]|nr:hypothetical protein [Alphaproteobacteria bacterium]